VDVVLFSPCRLMYMSATFDQIVNQFFAGLKRFALHRYFAGWQRLESELRTSAGGFLFGRASDVGGNIEGIHDQVASPAALLVDEAKSIEEGVLETLSRCHVTFRLYASSTGPASGGFYRICTAQAHLWRTFRVPSSECGHVSKAEIEADRENLKDSVFRIKHGAEWLYDAGESMISLEHVRGVIADPPRFESGKVRGFCDFAAGGDESVLAVCEGNRVRIVEAWRHKDTMHSVGKFLTLFRNLGLGSYSVGGDEGYGHQLMDRMAEQGFYLKRVNNGAASSKPNLYANLGAEWWSVVGELIEHRKLVLPGGDEKLVMQLTSRQKLYDSRGREKLESKAEMKARGLESPDRADALIGAVMLGRPVGGGVTSADLNRIVMGGGDQLYRSEPVVFGSESEEVEDIRERTRYPFI
jgi:phage terminase large subunit